MLENTSTPAKTVLYFITRIFILVGMVLFFSSVSYIAGIYACKVLYGFDFMENPELLNSFAENPYVLNALKLLQVIITVGAMFIPAWFFPKALEQHSETFLQVKQKPKLLFWILGIAMIFTCVPLISWLVEWNAQLTLPASMHDLEVQLKLADETADKMTKAFVTSTTLTDFLINILVVAIVPAIAEELLFRGALQQFIQYCFKNVHVAVVVSAIIFSAFHGQVYGFFPRVVLGILLGYLFAYSGSLWPSVIAHFINNAITLCIVHFHLDETGMAIFNETYHFSIPLVLFSFISCIAIVYMMYTHRKQFIDGY